MEDLKILIIPDVHGRSFWREPVKKALEEGDTHIIFLGDYVDPYPYEWENDDMDEVNYHQIAVDVLAEIIDLKKANPDRITLLLGNHDCSYAVSDYVCDCRRDRKNAPLLEKMFEDNSELFALAHEITINGKHFIFSHAGISKEYAEFCFSDKVNEDNVVDLFNNAWLTRNYGIMDSLAIYDHFRGWGGQNYASLVWADAREWGEGVGYQQGYGSMIFGHTQLKDKPYIIDNFACLDCRRAFYLDGEGNIRDYVTKEVQEPTKK